jgi:hypothetical protein
MKLSKLKEIVLEVLQETNEQSATAGAGGYSTPLAFSKNGKKNRATKYGEKLGYTTVKTKKRPYNTKMFDYLDENDTRKI